MEDAGFASAVSLETLDTSIGFATQWGVVVGDTHEIVAAVGRHVLAFGCPVVEDLLAHVERPVKRWRVVVDQLGVGHDLADRANHVANGANVWCGGFDPQQIGAVLQTVDAVEHAALFAGAVAELVQTVWQPHRANELAVLFEQNFAVFDVVHVCHFVDFEEGQVLAGGVARLLRNRKLLGEAGTEGVGTSNDHTVVDTQLKKGVADGVDLGIEVFVRNRDLAVLMTALLGIAHLVFNLDATCASFDHLLGQQVTGFFVAEARIDIGDDRHDMGFEVVDRAERVGLGRSVASGTGFVEVTVDLVELTGVGLLEEVIELSDELRHNGLLVHGLIRKWTEVGAHCCDHPAGQVQVTASGGAVVLLDSDHLLLADEAVPAAQALGVTGYVFVVTGHVIAHDLCGVLGDVEAGQEAILQLHASRRLGADCGPWASALLSQRCVTFDG